ncbi:MobF family relaxase [Rhodococcus qingshengii]|uniref:MobF family relaxase n=1 Tax=Rhodococcus qingshengii TaxID=334542 RepID=UPI00237CA1EC|nr:MobF family relaxase [Rhodococcus qingshengii]WCT06227.1 MobF family relaxase [Rhodococcus qingshengii]
MTLHVLHAGDGYEYLTSQVANADREREHGQELTDYYSAHGTPPGTWFGGGLEDLARVDADTEIADEHRISDGATVSEPQMKALFGEGMHPNADPMVEASIKGGMDPKKAVKEARLGRKFPDFANDIPLLKAHRAALEQFAVDNARRPSKAESGALMEKVGTALFEETHQRSAQDPQELWSWISAQKNRVRQPVAGQDLVFTPPKSVSTMWALADDDLRRQIERIHHETVKGTLGWIEKEACFTRTGATSQEHQDTTGMVATLYDHYDSRAGDPNLHTHAVVSIKVCTEKDGKWRALDGATLHRYAVAASQRYNAAIMSKMHTELGFGLTERSTGRGRQNVVEIAEVPQQLCEMFSSRRTQIETRRDQLVVEYRDKHGRMPSAKAMYALYQQANLDTRAGKQAPQTLREMQNNWITRSVQILGDDTAVRALAEQWRGVQREHAAGVREHRAMRRAGTPAEEAKRVVEHLENGRATWAITHIHSAVDANFAAVSFPDEAARAAAVKAVTEHVLGASVHLPAPELPPAPEALRRRDGEFILTNHGTALHTSASIITAEQFMLDSTRTPTAYIATQAGLDKVVEKIARTSDHPLNAGQRELAEHFVGSGTLLAVGIGPAGTGKTTSMKAVTDTWTAAGYEVIALAPSAVAAETLGEEIGVTAHTLATLTYPWRGLDDHEPRSLPEHIEIPAGAMLLVDEASLASTKDLSAITEIAAAKGAVVRLLGDPNQLDAVETGGALRLLAEETNAPELTVVVRFGDDTEQAENSLALRRGEESSLELFYSRGWVHEGTAAEMKEAAAVAYLADIAAGKTSIVMLSTRDDVREVNLAIQAHYRAAGTAKAERTVALSDELDAGVGDIVLTRKNKRRLRIKGGKRRNMFVRNGDLWTVTAVNENGSLNLRSKTHEGTITLPARYVKRNTELGYAATEHRSQGITVDTSHTAVGHTTDRPSLYVATTRGRTENHLYVPVEPGVTQDTEGMHLGSINNPASREVLEKILANDNGHKAAITEIREALEHARSPERLREAYHAAHSRLRDRWLDDVLDRALPAALLATIAAENPGSLAELRTTLGHAHDRGDSARRILNDALATGELHTARDVARVLNSRIVEATHAAAEAAAERADTALPPLPPRTTNTDKELDDYARILADRYAAARPEHERTDGIGATIRRYDETRAQLDTTRIHRPVREAFEPDTAERILADASAHRFGRHLRRAALAGIAPEAVLSWHAQQLAARGEDVTAATLIKDMAPAITAAVEKTNTRWAEEHGEILRGHFPYALATAARTEDPRWIAAAGRIRELVTHAGFDLDDLCRRIGSSAHRIAHITDITTALDAIAPPAREPVDPAAPHWVPSPDLDAHLVDPALAEQLDATYTDIAAEHTANTRRIAADDARGNAPELRFTEHLEARPEDPDMAAKWDRTAAEIQAYRDRYNITDTTSVAGDRPENKADIAPFNTVHRDIDTLHERMDEHSEEQRRAEHEQATVKHHHTIAQHVEHDQQRRGPRL